MAITATAPMYAPFPPGIGTSVPAFTNMTTDASGEKWAVVMQAPKTGSIRKIHVRTGGVVTPTDVDFRLETVDLTNGQPTGTLFGANTNVTVASASIVSNTWIASGALTADAVVTKGDLLAVVIAPTGTPNIVWVSLNNHDPHQYYPYTRLFTASWQAISSDTPIVALEYSDGSFAFTPHTAPISTINTRALNTGTTPDEGALKFTTTGSVRVVGAWTGMDTDGNYDLVLYDTDGTTVLTSISVDKDLRRTFHGPHHLLFPTPVTLAANSTYYLSVKPTTATTTNLVTYTVNATGLLTAMNGVTWHYATRTDAGAWSATTTEVPLLGLIVDGIDDGTGSGSGGSLHHGLVPPHHHSHRGRK